MAFHNNNNQVKMDIPDQVIKNNQSPVICLGIEFTNDAERRKYFTEKLHEKLKDPEFRKTEGFPIGDDEDILAISDPPYYTACPNPWIKGFIEEWDNNKPLKADGYQYYREPFATDVSEGKNHPIYNAHSYHTKVPHKAVMRYILHYTEPGDIVFDGFCGTGMTGVAARLCGDRNAVSELGYKVKQDGTVLKSEVSQSGVTEWVPFSRLGVRKSVMTDISTIASKIAYSYNSNSDVVEFERKAKQILEEVEKECGWMYETIHNQNYKARINYVVWSDVFYCPNCGQEIVFWEAAVDKILGKVVEEIKCTSCRSILTKKTLERKMINKYDLSLDAMINVSKQVPVLINYSYNGKRFEKEPEQGDLDLLKRIEELEIPYWIPISRLIYGKETNRNIPIGITHVHQFYTKRNIWVHAAIYKRIMKQNDSRLLAWHTSSMIRTTKMYKYMPTISNGKLVDRRTGTVSGTLYIPSMSDENSPFDLLKSKISDFTFKSSNDSVISCASSENIIGLKNIDYIFLDPPFGANLNYAELNNIWESWLKVFTNTSHEAIENPIVGKKLSDYRDLMLKCFRNAFNVLKPGRWITIEFSNTNAAVWNSIQTALAEVGFIIANVSALDKQQGSFKAVTTPTAVKQDLVISAYKPSSDFEYRFQNEALTENGVWDFTRTHLKYLPITKFQDDLIQFVPERDPRILFDQMVSYYVQKGFMVPISSHEYQTGLVHRFVERDGMFFLPEQAPEFDKKKLMSGQLVQMDLVMSDEATAIDWLRLLLKEKPQTFAEINPQFMTKLGGWSKYESNLDLRELLSQNFISYDGKGSVPEQIHTYLSTNWREYRNLPKDDPSLVAKAKDRWYVPDPNKAGDLEKLRERSLLKEFDIYKNASKRLKQFRLEAVRAGFKKAWQDRDYATIVSIAEKIPNNVLEEDPKLLMWYDQAMTRLGR